MLGLFQRKLRPGGLSIGFARKETHPRDPFPWDVMELILEYAVQVYHDGTKPKFIGNPFLLSRVCKDWQSYLDSKPQFWSSIIISLHKSERWRDIYISGLQGWFKRARDLPLHIYLNAEISLYGLGLQPQTEPYLCMIMVNSCSQWGSLDTSPVHDSFANRFQKCFKEANQRRFKAGLPSLNYPLLRSYVVRGSPGPGPDSVSLLTKMGNIPCLRTLQMDCYDKYLPFMTFKGDTITNVKITTLRTLRAYTVLLSYPMVEVLEIQYFAYDPAPHLHDGTRVTSTRLRSIKITAKTFLEILHLLNCLQTPNLEELYLHSHDVVHHGYIPNPISYSIQAMGCHLRRLSLQLVILDESHLIHLLWATPSLEELYTRHLEIPEAFSNFKGLTQASFNILKPISGCLPKLTILEYEGPLAIDSLEPIETLISRMDLRRSFTSSDLDPSIAEPGADYPPQHPVVRLRFTKIVTNQRWQLFGPVPVREPSTPSKLVRLRSRPQPLVTAEVQPPKGLLPAELLERIRSLMDRNELWLLNNDGSKWE